MDKACVRTGCRRGPWSRAAPLSSCAARARRRSWARTSPRPGSGASFAATGGGGGWLKKGERKVSEPSGSRLVVCVGRRNEKTTRKTHDGGVLEEGDGRHVDEVRPRGEALEEDADEAHVVVLREPRHHVDLVGEAEHLSSSSSSSRSRSKEKNRGSVSQWTCIPSMPSMHVCTHITTNETTSAKIRSPTSQERMEMRRIWARRLACVTITPLGAEVDPDVYWRKARSSGPGLGCWRRSVCA